MSTSAGEGKDQFSLELQSMRGWGQFCIALFSWPQVLSGDFNTDHGYITAMIQDMGTSNSPGPDISLTLGGTHSSVPLPSRDINHAVSLPISFIPHHTVVHHNSAPSSGYYKLSHVFSLEPKVHCPGLVCGFSCPTQYVMVLGRAMIPPLSLILEFHGPTF